MKAIKKICAVPLALALIFGSMTSALASSNGNSITFHEENLDLNVNHVSGKATEATEVTGIEPKIDIGGAFTFSTNGTNGETLVSTEFYFTKSTAKVNAKATGLPNSYIIYLERKDTLVWTTVSTATYYTSNNGTVYGITHTGLSTTKKYRLRFYSPNGTVNGSGTVTNYKKA